MHNRLILFISNFYKLKLFKFARFTGYCKSLALILYSCLFLGLYNSPAVAQPVQKKVDLGTDDWHRTDRHDGYVTGNGHIYMVGALGQTLTRSGKSFLTDEPVSLTRLAWVNGPLYSVGNLGYGWELIPEVDGSEENWESESVLSPTADEPFWRVYSETQNLSAELTDIIVEEYPVLLRRVRITRPADAPDAHVRLTIPVYPDSRNGEPFQMWNGDPVEEQRPSVSDDELIQLDEASQAIVLKGAPRALWQEISTPVPSDEDYAEMFPPRALATTVTSNDPGISVTATESGIEVDLGVMEPGAVKEFGIWLVTTTGSENSVYQSALDELSEWTQKDIAGVAEQSKSALPEPLIQRTDADEDPFTTIIESTTSLSRATQAASGCVLAQPYMYPMCYVRDQLGTFKTFMAQAEYERAFDALAFYIAMQNRYGIQNAYDTPPAPPDPTIWHPEANSKDGHHRIAEVPSIIILMARDYYRATGDLSKIEPLYDRLAYNLRVQERNENGLLPSPGDESYTNSAQTAPEYRIEMTDSNLLFISAAQFMSHLADTLGFEEDSTEFKQLEKNTEQAMMDRLWLEDGNYFAYARSASDNPDEIDRRPALDLLLRWFWLEMSDPLDSIPQQNLETVLSELVNPVRVVPEVYDFTAGMDLGYLLYALSRSQHPAMHDAARLMVNYASDSGLFSEYYEHEDRKIIPFSGTLRPWESGINAAAMVQYLLGLQPDMPNHSLSLQPHLPPDWNGWQTREIQIYEEGTLSISMVRSAEKEIEFEIQRNGGDTPLTVHLSFGGYDTPLVMDNRQEVQSSPRPDIIQTTFTLEPSKNGVESSQKISFRLDE